MLLQHSYFMALCISSLYSWSLTQLFSVSKGISKLASWVRLGHDYCSEKCWGGNYFMCKCLLERGRDVYAHTPFTSVL